MTSKTTYGIWEGNPTILIRRDSGRIDAFEYCADQAWHPVHPADASTKASVMSGDLFHEMWPGLKLPDAAA